MTKEQQDTLQEKLNIHHNEWQYHPYTDTFIKFLQDERIRNLTEAETIATEKPDDVVLMRNKLVQAAQINKILKYAQNPLKQSLIKS